MFARLTCLLPLCLAMGCPAARMQVADPVLEAGQVRLAVSSPDSKAQPLFDRVDLLLLPGDGHDLPTDSPGSGEYFDAIRNAQGFYMGGDYLEDAERESGEASYELVLPTGTSPPEGCSAWLVCLGLEGTAVHIRQVIPLQDWP